MKNYIRFNKIYIFCIWIWIIAFMYLLNFITFSPLYLSFFALLFTLYHNLVYKKNKNPILSKLWIILFEIFVFIAVYYKHFIIDKRKVFDLKTSIISLLIFLIYLVFLRIFLNRTFYEYYFIDIL